MNGENLTGVTTFLIDDKIDTGNILLRKELPVGRQENAGELHDRLMHVGAGLVVETVEGLCRGDLHARPQDEFMDDSTILHAAPKIHKEDCRIEWDGSGTRIVNKIRGLSPYPGAFSVMNLEEGREILFKIYEAAFKYAVHDYPTGTIFYEGRKSMKVAVEEGYVTIVNLQQEGKKRMDVGEFLLGFQPISGQHRFS
jgi:methionyl-tRNA formyltransferase